MKTLIFEGAGWEKADSSIKSGVGNYRIRTRIRNNVGRLIYLEMSGTEVNKKPSNKKWIGYNYNFFGVVNHCFYADSKWDLRINHSENLSEVERYHFEYNKENILKLVNEKLNCSFDNMEVINDGSVRVHDTSEPLCDCSNGDYEPYKDIEVNISVLDGVKPILDRSDHRHAQYRISYNYIKQHEGLKNWIEQRSDGEKAQFPNYKYYAHLRWDKNGIITSGEISARQNFVCMGLSLESLIPVIDEILKCEACAV